MSVLLCESGYLADELVSIARSSKEDWLSVRKKNRTLETNRCVLQETAGPRIPLAGPHMVVEDLVPLIPCTASRTVTVQDTTSWTCTLAVPLGGLGTVRLIVSVAKAEWTGTSAVWVPKRVDGSAPRMIALYGPRGPIATW